VLGVLLVAACGSQTADPNQVLRDAARAMAEVRTLQADMAFGPGAKILGFELVSATGKVKRPSMSDTVGKVRTGGGGGLIQPELVTVDGRTCLRQAQFLPFQRLDAAQAATYPSAGRLLDADHGVTAALPRAKGAALAGSEQVDGQDTHRITATYSPDVLNEALAPIVLVDDVRATLWIDKKGSLVRRVRITGHLFDQGTESHVDVRLHDFNAPLDISADC
jgi:hypothetical protein